MDPPESEQLDYEGEIVIIIGKDGRNAAMLTLVIVFLLLWIDFRHPGHALMAMTPLAIGIMWMVGIMQLFGDKLDVMNVRNTGGIYCGSL